MRDRFDPQFIYQEQFLTGGKNNEPEALRSWRNALETIYYHNAYRVPPNYVPKNETERVLQESIRQLELQCKERVDLLEALQESRKEAAANSSSGGGKEAPKQQSSSSSSSQQRAKLEKGKKPVTSPVVEASSTPGWIADGTVPAMDYDDLCKPPALPPRPQPPSRSSSSSVKPSGYGREASVSPSPLARETSRGSSPERRRVMLTTLRQKKDGSTPKKGKAKASSGRNSSRPAASKAAGLAWGSLGLGASSSGDSVTETDAKRERTETNKVRAPPPDYFSPSYWREPQVADPLSSSSRSASALPEQAAAAAASKSLSANDPQRQSPRSAPLAGKEYVDWSPGPDPPSFNRSSSTPQASSIPRLSPAAPRGPRNYASSPSEDEQRRSRRSEREVPGRKATTTAPERQRVAPPSSPSEDSAPSSEEDETDRTFRDILKKLPRGIDVTAARQILNDVIVRGDDVHWDDIAGLETAKNALKEAVVYPFLRPELFRGLREPARGMLLFGPPGTGKTMLARAVATESKSTFFSVSSSTLTSKWHGESEKLVRALFGLAKALAPSIIFVDEIDSLLSMRSSGTEHEASRRSKTEFLIQWSDLQRAAAGAPNSSSSGDASRVLVLAATNLPWDIDEAARRRFVRRQYIPLPESPVREQQLRKLLSHQKHELTDDDIEVLVQLTEGIFVLSPFFVVFSFNVVIDVVRVFWLRHHGAR